MPAMPSAPGVRTRHSADSSKVNTGDNVNNTPVKPEPSLGMTEKISRLGNTSDTSAETR